MRRFVQVAAAVVLRVLFVILLLPAAAYAQAAITGVVRDTSGGVLPGVTVEAASPVLIEKVRSVVSDDTRPVPHRRSAARHVLSDVHHCPASAPCSAKASSCRARSSPRSTAT